LHDTNHARQNGCMIGAKSLWPCCALNTRSRNDD